MFKISYHENDYTNLSELNLEISLCLVLTTEFAFISFSTMAPAPITQLFSILILSLIVELTPIKVFLPTITDPEITT